MSDTRIEQRLHHQREDCLIAAMRQAIRTLHAHWDALRELEQELGDAAGEYDDDLRDMIENLAAGSDNEAQIKDASIVKAARELYAKIAA